MLRRFNSLAMLVGFLILSSVVPASAQPARDAAQIDLAPPAAPQLWARTMKSKSYALLIGNYDYEIWPKLPHAKIDVEAIRDALVKHDHFDEDKVILKSNLGIIELENAIKEFLFERGADPDARLLIWYAGHGDQTGEGERRQGYLVPVTAPRRSVPNFGSWLARHATSLSGLRQWLSHDLVQARHILVIIDSCFGGAIRHVVRGNNETSSPGPNNLWWMHPIRYVIAAGDARQEVYDDGEFARLFIAAISNTTNKVKHSVPGYLTGVELASFLKTQAGAIHEQRQTPVDVRLPSRLSRTNEGEFFFKLPQKEPPDVSIPRNGSTDSLSPASPVEDHVALLERVAKQCVGWRHRQHQLAPKLSQAVARIWHPSRGPVSHSFNPFQVYAKGPVITEPDQFLVAAAGSKVIVTYTRSDGEPENHGEMILFPVRTKLSIADDVGEISLRGAWSRGSGLGCIVMTLNLRAGVGNGETYLGPRNRLDLDVAGLTRIPLKSTLTFAPYNTDQ